MSGKQKIGNYTVLQTLGVGSFGKVKLAVHSQTGHKVALKIIGRSKLAHSDMIGRVNREIQYLKMLRHPHIIKLYEVITTPTDIIMVIEYAGGELFNYIVERGRMAEKDARRFFQQIVSAVEYCHRRNIVHRDLKPENVLLDPYNNVKVADFGLSNIMKDGEFLQTSCGSPNYAAPEVINGKLYAGPEVDAWSCGVILYVMLCGRLPFDDDHIPALFKKITSGVFTMPGFLSPGAKQVLSGLLQVDPLKRMSLSQVRQLPWFTTDLPEYLKPLPESTDIESLARLDESILGELEKQLEMTRVSLIKQLRQRGTNTAKVAYQLTLDNRHMLEQSRHSNTQGIRNFALASSPPAAFNAAAGGLHDLRDRIGGGGSGGGTASSSPLANNSNDDDDDGTPSSIAILGSSLPRSAGHTLESQMYKMRLRGPNAVAAPRVSSPLAPSHDAAAASGSHSSSGRRPVSGAAAIAHQALGASGATPSRTPSNYFRAQLPPLPGTSANNGAMGQSNASSVASLAHASVRTASQSHLNPYSHRSGNSSENSSADGSPSGSVVPPHSVNVSSPLARSNAASASAEGSDNNSVGNQTLPLRKPTVIRKRAKLTRTRWHFGIRSRSPPADVMAEVYRALMQLGMQWKHFNPYHLRARYVDAQNREVKIDLQLYKLDSRDNYLVDFKAVIPTPKSAAELGFGSNSDSTAAIPTYRAGENTLIAPPPPFIQAARRRLSSVAAAGMPHPRPISAALDDVSLMISAESAEPRSLDDQFLDSDYPIQIPAEVPHALTSLPAGHDRSDMLPEPDTLPARTMQRRLGGSSPMSTSVQGFDDNTAGGVESTESSVAGGIPIPGSLAKSPINAIDINPRRHRNNSNIADSMGSTSGQFIGGTPRSQGRAPGSYMPGSVVGRVSLARADVSLTADGVGAGNGASRQAQERVVNAFPFFDVCCRLITELAVPSAPQQQQTA